jgi:hypothetical protein
VEIEMPRLAQLDTIPIRARRTGVFGKVIARTGFSGVPNAEVTVVGVRGFTQTDTAGDFNLTAETTFTPSQTGFVAVNLTGLVQKWVNGDLANNGVMLMSSTPYNESKYASKEYGDYSRRPSLKVEYIPIPNTSYSSLVNANALHSQNITGAGVTVAVVDTGYWSHPAWITHHLA